MAAMSAIMASLAICLSCGRSMREDQRVPPSVRSSAEVEELWKAHEDVLVGVLQGRKFSEQEFVTAVDFFARTTGIPSNDSGTYVGRIPNANLPSDLERWREWYAENAALLYLDHDTGEIKRRH